MNEILDTRIYVHKLSNGTRYIRPKVKDEMKPELKMKKLSNGTRYIRPKVKDEMKPKLKMK